MTTIAVIARSALRAAGGVMSTGGIAVFFAVLLGSLFGIALAPVPQAAQAAAPAIIWLCTLVAATLSLEPVWHRPLSSGRFDLLLLSGVSPLALVAGTVLAQWCAVGVPLALAGGILALVFGVPLGVLPLVGASLALATFYLCLTGALAAVMTHGARQPGVLMVVVIMPLQVPMLLLSLMAVERAQLDTAVVNAYVYLQVALVLFAAPLVLAGAGWLLRAHHSR